MRRRNKSGKVNKGAPSGLVISLMVHAVAFFLAGLFVIVKVLPQPPEPFVPPPPVERPKMKLKKPQVKVKRSSTPKPSSRIVAKVRTASMPEIMLPDLIGTGEGLLGGSGLGGDFLDMPELDDMPTTVGAEQSIGNDLEGTFYNFNRNRNGKWTDFAGTTSFMVEVNKFLRNGWNPVTLSRYYRSPKKLYATCIVVSPTDSSIAPSAFDSINSGGGYWMVHYKGKLVHKDGITFRFVCSSDYFIVIRVDGEIVWAGVWNTPDRMDDFLNLVGPLYSPRTETRRYFIGNDRAMAGEWITLEPGVAKNIDIIIGDEEGECGFIVAIEEKDGEYEKNNQGGPILPIFKTAELSRDMLDQIYKDLPEGEVSVTNGPVFKDF